MEAEEPVCCRTSVMRSRAGAAQMMDNSRKWGREKEELLHKLHEKEGPGYASRQVRHCASTHGNR